MEWINEYIQLELSHVSDIVESSCYARQDEQKVYLSFSLSNKDCLFDFSNINNYVNITIAKSYFEKYEEPFDISIEKQSICCNTQSKLFELINSNLKGLSRKVFLESIVLHLVFQIQKNNLVFEINCSTCSFLNKPNEVDKIEKAKLYIINNFDQAITIPMIASHVGTNQCYLKKGFKEITGQTLFEFIQENRMIKAKHYLQNTEASIADVASNVGYASVSSFSQAYKNYYGISPSSVLK